MKRIVPIIALSLAAATAHADEMMFDCLAEPAQRIQIGSPVTGLLASVAVGRGARVKPGDLLARLDSAVEEANLALAKAQAEAIEAVEAQRTRLALAESSLARSQKLISSEQVSKSKIEELEAIVAIARRDLDTEQRRLHIAEIELARQQAILDRQSIRSPIGGFVAEQSLRAGEFVRQDSSIMTLVQTDPLHVEAYLPVALWGRITAASHGSIVLDQPDRTRRAAPVTVVDHVFDAASGTFGVRLELPNPSDNIPAGQRCQVFFDVPDTAPSSQ